MLMVAITTFKLHPNLYLQAWPIFLSFRLATEIQVSHMHLSINRPTNKLSIFPFKSLPFPCFYLNNSMNSPVLKFKRLCKTPQVSSTSDQLVNTSDRVYLLNLSSQSHLFPMPNALVYFQPYFLNTQNFPTRPQASSLACCSSLLSSSSPYITHKLPEESSKEQIHSCHFSY